LRVVFYFNVEVGIEHCVCTKVTKLNQSAHCVTMKSIPRISRIFIPVNCKQRLILSGICKVWRKHANC